MTFFSFHQAITRLDISILLRQFATLLNAGMSILQCCNILESNQAKPSLRWLIYQIKRDILHGETLTSSMQHQARHFDHFTCQLIAIGEQTGKLDLVLTIVADYHEQQIALQRRIRQALFYPLFVASTALLITLGLFIFIIPRFADLFAASTVVLPLLTRCIFQMALILQHEWWLMIICFISLIGVMKIILTKLSLTTLCAYLPFIRHGLRKQQLAYFARQFAITTQAGMPVKDGLTLTATATQDPLFALLILQLRNTLVTGLALHKAMANLPQFPPLMTQMIKIGEECGKLDDMLDKLADFFEADVNLWLNRCTQLLEPLIMLVLGVLIGGIIIGMYLPIFKLGSLF